MTSIINRNGVNINLDTVVNDLNGKADIDLVNLSAEGKKKISSLCRRSVLGELVQSTIPLTDPGLHLLNGAVLTYDIYEDFIDYIADLYNKGTYTQLFETEANWQTAVTQYGVCGKFVYDSQTNTVRLPKITGMVEGTTDATALGALVEAGLPNITGTYDKTAGSVFLLNALTSEITKSGAFYTSSSQSDKYSSTTGSGDVVRGFGFDASLSNSIYGNSTTVQPQTIKVLYYIVVAGVQGTGEGGGGGTAIVDVDGITTALEGKSSVNLNNLTAKGEKHFLNKTQVTNCILETPSNWMTYSGSQVTVKAGTKYLVPNGRNTDGTLNNIEVTLQSDVVYTNTGQYNGTICILGVADGSLWSWGSVATMGYYRNSSEFPIPATGFYWLAFSEEDNSWYITADGGAYTQSNVCLLGTAKITSDSSILSINPFKPVHLLTIGNREEITGWSMPSTQYLEMTVGASGTVYTAPANGYFQAQGTTDTQQNTNHPIYWQLMNDDGTTEIAVMSLSTYSYGNGWVAASVPVKKGYKYNLSYGRLADISVKFFYAVGSESEAQ